MQRGRGGRDDFFDFGDPFPAFGGFGGHRSLFSSVFGGRDPFDDPFFTRPFGSMFGPSGSSFGDIPASGFLEHEAQRPNASKGPIIEELNSDDEFEGDRDDQDNKYGGRNVKGETPGKHAKGSKEPYVQHPDDEAEEKKGKHMQHKTDSNKVDRTWPQSHNYSFQSSKVTYGGANGAYYTSSKTRRTGSDGVMVEEGKEADTTTGQATHRISKGIHNQGHSVTRKLNSDGKVDTMQTLHNLNEDELARFEEAWKGNVDKHFPGWNEGFNMDGNMGASNRRPGGQAGWALPFIDRSRNLERMMRSDDNGARSSASGGKPIYLQVLYLQWRKVRPKPCVSETFKCVGKKGKKYYMGNN